MNPTCKTSLSRNPLINRDAWTAWPPIIARDGATMRTRITEDGTAVTGAAHFRSNFGCFMELVESEPKSGLHERYQPARSSDGTGILSRLKTLLTWKSNPGDSRSDNQTSRNFQLS